MWYNKYNHFKGDVMNKKFILLLILVVCFTLVGCGKKKNSEKQLIGFTIYEKSNTIGESQKFDKLNDIEINGIYASDDYSFVSVKGDSLFDTKTDTSKLQGDMITLNSVCLFITANYYQSQNVNYKLFLYEIYMLEDGSYLVQYKADVNLSSEVGDTQTLTFANEAIKNDLNYVFTYKINFIKIATPQSILVKEFNENNEIILETELTTDISEYRASKDCSYILVEEYNVFLDENDEEKKSIDYTLITEKTQKKNYTFKLLNEANRVVNFQVTFAFKDEVETRSQAKSNR